MNDRGRLLLGAFDTALGAVAYAARVATTDEETIRARWPATREAFLALSAADVTATAADLDAEMHREIGERMDAPLFNASLAGRRWRVAAVPLRALIMPQPAINLTRVEAMIEKLRSGVVAALFPTTTTLAIRAEASDGPTLTLIGDRAELVVSGVEARRSSESGAIEVVFRIEPRPNYVSILHCSDRFIIRNGNHRFVAAWRAGLREVPAVIVESDGSDVVERWDRLRPASLSAARPPLLTDIVNGDASTVEVRLRSRRSVTRLRCEQSAVTTTKVSVRSIARFERSPDHVAVEVLSSV